MELTSCHLLGAQNFEMARRFLENTCTRVLLYISLMRFIAVTTRTAVLWVITPCSLFGGYGPFGRN